MIVLLTEPNERADEGVLLNRMLAAHPALIVHLRKPESHRLAYEKAIGAIDTVYHPRIVLHQHHELSDFYDVKGVHFTERHRAVATLHPKVVSTSFHTLTGAQTNGMIYEYFFCSPVFASISKQEYTPTENWNITDDSEAFRDKAVALGGISPATLPAARKKGFRHFAVLGAVWQASDPVAALTGLAAQNDAGLPAS